MEEIKGNEHESILHLIRPTCDDGYHHHVSSEEVKQWACNNDSSAFTLCGDLVKAKEDPSKYPCCPQCAKILSRWCIFKTQELSRKR